MSQNIIDASGIQIQTYSDVVNDIINGTPIVPGLVSIYGSDINVDSNTPDGQWINIFALSKIDIENLCVSIYNSFDPNQAVGVALDSLCQLNSSSLLRKGGILTQVVVTVNVTGTFTLNGLDTSSPYTISDANGNLFNLISSTSVTTGNNNLNFQAAQIGFIQILANTLTVQVSIIAGVNSVNNPSTPYQIGSNQETDSQLRIRRSASTAIPAQGFNQSLYGGLNQIEGLTQAVIYENDTGSINADSVPGHSIWVIVNGGSDADVADTIYTYRNAGCGMYGSSTVPVTQVDGTMFNISFTRAVDQNLFIDLTVTSLSGGSVDATALKNALAQQYVLDINEIADITSITALIKSINPDILVQSAGVCATSMGSFVDSLLPTFKYNIWTVIAANITIVVD